MSLNTVITIESGLNQNPAIETLLKIAKALEAGNEVVLNLESTATFFDISTATVRNWVKCGYLKTLSEKTKYFFHLTEGGRNF